MVRIDHGKTACGAPLVAWKTLHVMNSLVEGPTKVSNGESHFVRPTEIVVASDVARLECSGLGSSVIVMLFDSIAHCVGVSHAMLPVSPKDKPIDRMGKYVDLAIRELVEQLVAHGADRDNLNAVIVGGSQMFAHRTSLIDDRWSLGARNVNAATATLSELNIKICGTDTGGSLPRTVVIDLELGEIRCRSFSENEYVVENFGSNRA